MTTAHSANWITELFAWADENQISAEKLPRNEETLLSRTALDLSFCKLTQLPDCFCHLNYLRELDLAYNELTQLPDWLDSFTDLEKLNVAGNAITFLPESIRHLPKLEVLGLDKQIKIGKNMQSSSLKFESSLLKVLQDSGGTGNMNDVIKKVIEDLQISEQELLETVSTGESKVRNSIRWARHHLYEIGFIKNSKRGVWTLTEKGMQASNLFPQQFFKHSSKKSEFLVNIKTYQQKILFGSPGTGKSHKIATEILPNDLNIHRAENIIKTVFHPEYTYGDFVGKLVPITRKGAVEYNFYEGHFLKALSQAYKNLIAAHEKTEEIENVALVIDEINRGNSAAIFGTIFQLLDREPNGWSSYEVNINEITFERLLELCELEPHSKVKNKIVTYKFGDEEIQTQTLQDILQCDFKNRTVKIPPNLSILASMNTSDSSIYYMDSAFKRRWEWEFININGTSISDPSQSVEFSTTEKWISFVDKLNEFIKSNHKHIRGIEDKQIGHFFIKCTEEEPILKASIQNKLMFFLWDSVFNRDKKPLIKLLFDDKDETLITFGDFAKEVDLFIQKIGEI